ncbi:MAG: gamma carbonic anhydrase family protein, partial [Promethearchaeota archaeon]
HCDLRFPTRIGNRVTLGHNSVAHGCTIEDDVLIGIGAAILNNAHISDHCIVGAGCVVTPGAKIPAKSLVLGVPGKVVRSLTKADLRILEDSWQAYVQLSRQYLAEAQSSIEELK